MNDRAPDVLVRTFEGLKNQYADQMVLVYDRPPELTAACLRVHYRGDYAVHIEGPPGWLCPAKAWNAGFAEVNSELTFVMSSEVVLAPGAVERCKTLLGSAPAILFGKCEESEPGRYGGSTASGVLCSAEQARPLGFIACIPTWAMRATAGYDEAFMDGYWYDDDDFFFRLWKLGLPFLFEDSVSGVHQSHPRPVLDTPEGQAGIARNRAYILKKHGSEHPINTQRILGRKIPGKTLWVKDAAFLTPHHLKAWGFEE